MMNRAACPVAKSAADASVDDNSRKTKDFIEVRGNPQYTNANATEHFDCRFYNRLQQLWQAGGNLRPPRALAARVSRPQQSTDRLDSPAGENIYASLVVYLFAGLDL